MKLRTACLCIYFIFLSSAISYCFENQFVRVPSIICISGTCSAGKSTLIRAIGRSGGLEIVDEDSIMQRRYVEAVAMRFPKEFECIVSVIAKRNIYHALREKDVLFKNSAPEGECSKAAAALFKIQEELNKPENALWKQEVSLSISEEVIRRLKECVAAKKNVLLDAWYIKDNHLHDLFPTTPIMRILLYCPLPLAYERLLNRNAEAVFRGDLHEKRYLRQLIGSFYMLYQITCNQSNSIHRIDRQDLEDTLQAMAKTLKDHEISTSKPVFTFEEIPLSQFLKLKEDFLQPFDEENICFIAPRQEYDYIIDQSDNLDIQNTVLNIMDIISIDGRQLEHIPFY